MTLLSFQWSTFWDTWPDILQTISFPMRSQDSPDHSEHLQLFRSSSEALLRFLERNYWVTFWSSWSYCLFNGPHFESPWRQGACWLLHRSSNIEMHIHSAVDLDSFQSLRSVTYRVVSRKIKKDAKETYLNSVPNLAAKILLSYEGGRWHRRIERTKCLPVFFIYLCDVSRPTNDHQAGGRQTVPSKCQLTGKPSGCTPEEE
jgi:hypothetical protein